MSRSLRVFAEEMMWELSYISRYPVFEILLGFFAFITMLNFAELSGASSCSIDALSKYYSLHRHLILITMNNSILILFLITSLLTATLFTRGMEFGYLRDELSLPVTRGSLFLAKLFSAFLLLFFSILTSFLLCLLFLDPIGGIIHAMLSYRILHVIAFVATEIVLPLSISLLFSVLGRSYLPSMLSSFIFLVGLYLLAPRTPLFQIILPTVAIIKDLSYLSLMDISIATIKWGISLILMSSSYYYFEKRVEI